jgi:hypothetical protein
MQDQSQSQSGQDKTPVTTPVPTSTAIVVAPQQVARELVKAGLRAVPVTKLGIGSNRFSEIVVARQWNQDDVEQVLATRRDYNAGIPAIASMHAKGLKLDQIEGLYHIRTTLGATAGDLFEGFSLTVLYQFADAFGLIDSDPEALAQEILSIHEEVCERARYVRYLYQTMELILMAKRSFPDVDLAGAVESIVQRVPKTRRPYRDLPEEERDQDDETEET